MGNTSRTPVYRRKRKKKIFEIIYVLVDYSLSNLEVIIQSKNSSLTARAFQQDSKSEIANVRGEETTTR